MFMLRPVPTIALIFFGFLCIAFPPLFLVPLVLLVVKAVVKLREHTDVQARAWRAQQAWEAGRRG